MNSLSPRTLAVREQPLPEPVIQCPHCQGDIKLTESLAAPFIRAREAEFKRQEAGLREREAALDAQVAEGIREGAQESRGRRAPARVCCKSQWRQSRFAGTNARRHCDT